MNSAEATEHLETVRQMLNNWHFIHYMAETDKNYSTKTFDKLKTAIDSLEDLIQEFYA